jgi:hypothetical protein
MYIQTKYGNNKSAGDSSVSVTIWSILTVSGPTADFNLNFSPGTCRFSIYISTVNIGLEPHYTLERVLVG